MRTEALRSTLLIVAGLCYLFLDLFTDLQLTPLAVVILLGGAAELCWRLQLFTLRRRGRARHNGPLALYIGEEGEEVRLLRAVLEERHQQLLRVPTAEEALELLEALPVTLAVVGRDDQDRWKATLTRLLARRKSLCAILLSNVDDPYLWNEMVHLGGYEVISRPIGKAALHAVLASAELHFHGARPGDGRRG